ncbi:hypothetical protein D9615_008029 [Tricholomella constricta]|uniref:Uncharacterized protein n=1 Tax=Tricholomella constricta TaxID=117010 RepID=A0A8H5H220_9AGAR|nr:hypothetical protein D9615_008029 [Tricholomella constricta]
MVHSHYVQSVKTRLSSAYARITLNRVTTAFFIFSFVHCFAQGIIQSFLFSIDAEYNFLLSSITRVAGIPTSNMTYFEGVSGNLHLRMCDDIPHGQRRYPCIDIFRSEVDVNNFLVSNTRQGIQSSNRFEGGVVVSAVRDSTSKNITGVTLTSESKTVSLSRQCTQTLVYPQQITRNSMREDLTFVLLQFWLFAISVIAIMYDSVPHTLAVLMTRGLITAWSAFAVWRTKFIESKLQEMIFQNGTPCSFDPFPAYFNLRVSYEIPDLILNVTALLIACYLSLTLLRDYNAQSFKCVGAPEHINRINKFFMAVLACLQLEAFVLVAAMGLWIDVLINTAIAKISAHTALYKALFIVTAILLLPWITMGWYAIRREMRVLMVVFLGIAFVILSGWSIMFYSIVYRWSFMEWPYLGCFTVASLVLIIASVVLGVICRLNFGKGLAQYLQAEAALASSNFAPEVFSHDEEKDMDLDLKVPATFEQPEVFYVAPPTVTRGGASEHSHPRAVHLSPSQSSLSNVPYNIPF